MAMKSGAGAIKRIIGVFANLKTIDAIPVGAVSVYFGAFLLFISRMESHATENSTASHTIDCGPIRDSFRLAAQTLPLFVLLSLIAATGRALQVGAAGEPAVTLNILLEVIVEGARVAVFLLVLGQGKIAVGWHAVRRVFTGNAKPAPASHPQGRWVSLAVNIVIYAVIVAAANGVIHVVAKFTPTLESLRDAGLVARDAGEIILVLFLKNLTVVPWTLAFVAALVHWFSPPPRNQAEPTSGLSGSPSSL